MNVMRRGWNCGQRCFLSALIRETVGTDGIIGGLGVRCEG